MNYPARGETSEDGRYYTHTDGAVHERVPFEGCRKCSLFGAAQCVNVSCGDLINGKMAMFKLVEGAYVQTAEETEACDMAWKMIAVCGPHDAFTPCGSCKLFTEKLCPARAYLAKHGDATAWEVK